MPKLVFEPIKIGTLEIPNRIVRAAHTFSGDAAVTDTMIQYHVARARGGVGLSLLDAASVHESSHLTLRVSDDSVIEPYTRLMSAVRPFGMRVFQQLWHGGHHHYGLKGRIPWAPSTIPSPLSGLIGVRMGTAEIDEIVAAFAAAARRCKQGGLDGVEIHGAHGYLIHQFLSMHTNDRTDEYGGAIECRMRFLQEVLRAVRSATGSDFPVGVRLSVSTVAGGVTPADLIAVARALERENLIDYLSTSMGDHYEANRSSAAMDAPTGYELESSAQITSAVKIPRIVAGRYRTLEEAEQTLREGIADLVSLVRQNIADPDLVRKTREGRPEDVRPCIACNQGCVGGIIREGKLGCAVNPAVGAEATLSEHLITRATRPRKVVIVGGGPAGMEAARVAATAGHRVILFEAGAQLGGKLQIAKRAPGLQTIGDIADWLERQVYQLGVDVRTGSYVEAPDILAETPDVVIVATGAMARMNGQQIADPARVLTGFDLPHVLSSVDLMTRPPALSGTSCLILDDTGHYEAIAVADFLSERGLAVNYVTRLPSMAPALKPLGRVDPALRRLNQRTFRLFARHYLTAIRPGECTVRLLQSDKTEVVPADLVVLVTPDEPLRELYQPLQGVVQQLSIVGDANMPRELQAAVREGHLAARAIQ
jgi:2,4-dienoyl-CoA reductase-like NADH-dependent reductase (Old Yellow Enzyme family)